MELAKLRSRNAGSQVWWRQRRDITSRWTGARNGLSINAKARHAHGGDGR